jgi:hypothetical protein
LTFGVRDALSNLAALPPSLDAPYVTVSLDWTPAGEDPGREPPPVVRPSERRARRGEVGVSRRPSRREFERAMEQILASHGPRGQAVASLAADAARINAFLDDELDPMAKGVYIVSCAARGVFEPLAFALPVPTRVTVAPIPALWSLARIVDDYPAYAVLLVDQHQATISKIRRAARGRSVWLESSDWPRKQQTGGLSQRRLQSRAEERVAAFARRIADEVASTLETAEIQMLVVAGDEVMTSALAAAFPQSVSDRIIATIRLDIRASEQEVIEATLPLVEAVERDQELDAARAVTAELATNQAAAGAPAVLRALQTGQVATLVVVEDFAAEGWADFAREVYGVGPIPKEHPLAGDMTDIVPVALEEALIRLAVRTGADIQIIESGVPVDETGAEPIPPQGNPPPRSEAAQLLDDLGGIGALLRFSLE